MSIEKKVGKCSQERGGTTTWCRSYFTDNCPKTCAYAQRQEYINSLTKQEKESIKNIYLFK